jgi:hypothetical protein
MRPKGAGMRSRISMLTPGSWAAADFIRQSEA